LAVFGGGWTLDAADGVCAPELDWLTGLGVLIDQSLVQRSEQPDGSSRYSMLETIREYALEQLAGASAANGDIAAAKGIQPGIADEFASYGIR
jgi:hypothetical protein